MWQHEAGRIDFDKPLSFLLQRGWGFREYSPRVGVQGEGCWAVIGVCGEVRVRGDHSDRRDAWAEVVRLALISPVDHEGD